MLPRLGIFRKAMRDDRMRGLRILLILFCVALLSAACGRQVIRSLPYEPVRDSGDMSTEKDTGSKESPIPDGSEKPKRPGEVVSIQLTDQARRYLETGDVEAAIRVLERSIALHPYNGEGYYLLAEAWFLKKDPERAAAFNRMARAYFKEEASWKARIEDQYRKIRAMPEKARKL